MTDQFGDGLYRVSESRPCPVDGCDGEISAVPYSEDLLCDKNARHKYTEASKGGVRSGIAR